MSRRQKIVVLTGAGVSAESGIPTFRDADGLWEGHDVMEVASPQGWARNRELVLEFYNLRRQSARKAQPNAAHYALAELESKFDVTVITQNIDDLHERGGSTNVLHLHGEILKAQSSADPRLVYELGEKDICLGDKCERGSQLRPHVVWFGEMVPMMEPAVAEVAGADIFMVIGTSLAVYPAASLIHYAKDNIPKYIIDPKIPGGLGYPNLTKIPKTATAGVREIADQLLKG